MKEVAVVTGTRAEYGLLKSIIKKIDLDNELDLRLIVTGMHLSPEFGLTYKEIEEDGFRISEKIEMLLSSDTASGITKSTGIALFGFADIFSREKYDMVILLGDRYEILSAAIAAMINRIPIAHIHGGELTEGLIDEAIRHSITKMSILHFTSTEEYRKRVIQLGEQPQNVYCVGSLGVEGARKLEPFSLERLEENMGFQLSEKTIVVTYHPVTLEMNTVEKQFINLLEALEQFPTWKIIFTKSNADTDGRIINDLIDDYVNKYPLRAIAFTSLGQKRYLSLLKYAYMVVGNSSSGIIEAPSFQIPTINIGDRQKGRIVADTVISCGTNTADIVEALQKGDSQEFRNNLINMKNPYEKENTSDEIICIIKERLKKGISVKKEFYDIKW